MTENVDILTGVLDVIKKQLATLEDVEGKMNPSCLGAWWVQETVQHMKEASGALSWAITLREENG